MAHITPGQVVELAIKKRSRLGWLLDGGRLGELLLPARELEAAPASALVRVFIYLDGNKQPQVTTQLPRLLPGEIGRLRVVSVNSSGAFLDWGLPKDLLLPFAEQTNNPEPGRWQNVCVCLDKEGRPFASTKLNRFLADSCDAYQQGDAVPIVVLQRTDLGYKVAVDNRYWGLLATEGNTSIRPGQRFTAYVQRLREDQRLGLSLNPPGAAKHQGLDALILQRLQETGGQLALGDKSDPEAIRATFGCSKAAFKQAIGKLYKQRALIIEDAGIRLP